ncbi:MAG: DUF362 domain-containing protein [Bryobacterales bacterium]|nr:DUF362 domain-containing protein [Bryobacterales bacterium]
MPTELTRRDLLHLAAGAGAAAFALDPARHILGQTPPPGIPPIVIREYPRRSKVSLIHGEDRRKIVHDSLVAIEDQIKPVLKRKKYVVIKPNNVSTVNQLAATHADALRGMLDFLAPRFKGPVVIAESSAGDTMQGFQNFGYTKLPAEYKSRKIELVDLNAEAKFERIPVLDYDLHLDSVRLAARLLDPDAFVLCAACMKTHNVMIVTLSMKNMTLGAPLHQRPGETPRWNDKRKYHAGIRQGHYNMLLTAQKLAPFWGATVIDGFEGMEGNGPSSGTPVPSRVAVASTDYIAADRVATECMGVNPEWPGGLVYCGQTGVGNWDINKIDVVGTEIAKVRKSYRLHRDNDRQLLWMGPMTDLPPKMG